MILIDKFSYGNGLRHVHPAEKTVFAMVSIMAALSFNSPGGPLLLALALSAVLITKAGIRLPLLLKFYSIPSVFIMTAILPLIIGYGETGLHIKNLKEGLALAVRSLSAVSAFYFLILSTPLEQIDYLLEKMRVPRLFRELLLLVYRFIFLLLHMSEEITRSQMQREGYRRFKSSIRSLGLLSSALLIKSMNMSRQYDLAMSSRGGSGEIRFASAAYTYDRRNLMGLALYTVSLTFAIIGESLWLI